MSSYSFEDAYLSLFGFSWIVNNATIPSENCLIVKILSIKMIFDLDTPPLFRYIRARPLWDESTHIEEGL